MTDQFDFFKRLKDYEVEPPAAVGLRIFHILETDPKETEDIIPALQLEQLQELEILPPPSLFTLIEKRTQASFYLSLLKNYVVAPPGYLFNLILKKIEAGSHLKKEEAGAVIRSIYRYRAAIAIVLITGIGWFAYQLAVSSKKPVIENAVSNIKPIEAMKDTIQKNSIPDINKNIAVAPVKKAFRKKIVPPVIDEKTMMSVGDYQFTVTNYDLMAAFASFDYQNLPSFITDAEGKGFTIQIDQFTAISVSEPMRKIIHRMNLYRRNGTLKARARRTRTRVEKWKKADTEQFDKSLINNPVDPLDLAEFIFK